MRIVAPVDKSFAATHKEIEMKPFILKQHEKDFAKVRELRVSELAHVAGGMVEDKLNTVTVTPNGDGGDDGKDAS
jgi:hypothetical protein